MMKGEVGGGDGMGWEGLGTHCRHTHTHANMSVAVDSCITSAHCSGKMSKHPPVPSDPATLLTCTAASLTRVPRAVSAADAASNTSRRRFAARRLSRIRAARAAAATWCTRFTSNQRRTARCMVHTMGCTPHGEARGMGRGLEKSSRRTSGSESATAASASARCTGGGGDALRLGVGPGTGCGGAGLGGSTARTPVLHSGWWEGSGPGSLGTGRAEGGSCDVHMVTVGAPETSPLPASRPKARAFAKPSCASSTARCMEPGAGDGGRASESQPVGLLPGFPVGDPTPTTGDRRRQERVDTGRAALLDPGLRGGTRSRAKRSTTASATGSLESKTLGSRPNPSILVLENANLQRIGQLRLCDLRPSLVYARAAEQPGLAYT
jgi:hypothetical protein